MCLRQQSRCEFVRRVVAAVVDCRIAHSHHHESLSLWMIRIAELGMLFLNDLIGLIVSSWGQHSHWQKLSPLRAHDQALLDCLNNDVILYYYWVDRQRLWFLHFLKALSPSRLLNSPWSWLWRIDELFPLVIGDQSRGRCRREMCRLARANRCRGNDSLPIV